MLTEDQASIIHGLAVRALAFDRQGLVMYAPPGFSRAEVVDALASLEAARDGAGGRATVLAFLERLVPDLRASAIRRSLARIGEALAAPGVESAWSAPSMATEVERQVGEGRRAQVVLEAVGRLLTALDPSFDGNVTATAVDLAARTFRGDAQFPSTAKQREDQGEDVLEATRTLSTPTEEALRETLRWGTPKYVEAVRNLSTPTDQAQASAERYGVTVRGSGTRSSLDEVEAIESAAATLREALRWGSPAWRAMNVLLDKVQGGEAQGEDTIVVWPFGFAPSTGGEHGRNIGVADLSALVAGALGVEPDQLGAWSIDFGGGTWATLDAAHVGATAPRYDHSKHPELYALAIGEALIDYRGNIVAIEGGGCVVELLQAVFAEPGSDHPLLRALAGDGRWVESSQRFQTQLHYIKAPRLAKLLAELFAIAKSEVS